MYHFNKILAVAFITFISWFDNNVINFFGFSTIKSIFIGNITESRLVDFNLIEINGVLVPSEPVLTIEAVTIEVVAEFT